MRTRTRVWGRPTVRQRIDSLKGREPWPGYDERTVEDIVMALSDVDEAHKSRAGVLEAAQRDLMTA